MKDGSPQLLWQFTTGAGGLKFVNLQAVRHVNGTSAPVAAELRPVRVETDGEGPVQGAHVPADQFALPSSADKKISVRAEVHIDRLCLVLAQNPHLTGLWVNQPHI